MDAFNQAQPTPMMSMSTGSGGGMPSRPPGENDVILGVGCNKHSGNLKFRQFIKAYKRARFRTNPKIETAEAVKEVVQFWRNMTPRGRFLTQNKNSNDGVWHEVDDKQAMRIASFFLMNQNGGELKRQKSIDAMKTSRNSISGPPPLMRSQSGPQPQPIGSGLGPDLLGSGLGGRAQSHGLGKMPGQEQTQMQMPDMMASLEPMPIGPSSSTSSTSTAWEKRQQAFQRRSSFQDPVKSKTQDDQNFDDFDFNPLPFKPNKEPIVDDFEPIQANFNNFASGNNNFTSGKQNLDVSTNAQSQYGGSSEQVQVSVNMVVNTMPQGFPRENGVNTVTNIQIGTGTINDERKKASNPSYNGDGFQGQQNFQLTTDTSNGFIQISAQSNPNGTDQRAMMNPGSSQMQMNDFQGGFFGNNNQDDGMVNNMNMNGQGNGSGFNKNNNGFINSNGNSGMMMGNNSNGMQIINGNMTGSVMNNNNNNNMANMNTNMKNNPGDGDGQKGGLRWNKNEVANSVPCAASLVGSVFDDW